MLMPLALKKEENKVLTVNIDSVAPCPYQPRKNFDISSLESLAHSIEENGILQPLTVTKIDGGYQLIAGHRRLIAAKAVGLKQVPVIVLDKSETEIAVLCTIENLQREDLNFFEQAQAIDTLVNELKLTQAQVGQKLCLSQPAVANKLKLLQFSQAQRQMMLKANLTERHARAIARLEAEKQQKAIEYVIAHQLNVAATDRYIEKLLFKKPKHAQKTIIRIKDIKLFTNTITKAIKLMQSAGFNPQYEQTNKEEFVEYKIKIPVNTAN